MILPIALLAGGAALLYFMFREDPGAPGVGVKGLPGAGANVPRPQDDPTRIPVTMPDGSVLQTHPAVSLAIYQAVSSGDPTYIRNTAKQLRSLGWSTEAAKLEGIASQVEGKAPSGLVAPGWPTPQPVTGVSPDLPPQLLSQLTAVVTRQNPAEMRAYAQQLRQAGHAEPAASLEAAAREVELAQAQHAAGQKAAAAAAGRAAAAAARGVPAVPAAPAPTQIAYQTPPAIPALAGPQPSAISVPMPTTVPTVATVPIPTLAAPKVPTTPRREAADALVRHLMVDAPSKPNENKEIVKRYQSLAGRTVDGKYGPGDARSLATSESGNHIPPPPRYWPRRTYAKAVEEYEAWLTQKKYSDTQRSAEWSSALAQARKHYPS